MVFGKLSEQKVNIISFFALDARGTYQGLAVTILTQGSNQAIQFFDCGNTEKKQYRKYALKGPNEPVPVRITDIFGLTVDAASAFRNTSLDVNRTRMQSLEASKYKNT